LTLFELARELFTYLVRFREKAPSTSAPSLPEVRRDLLGIFARMDNQAKRDSILQGPYRQVHYALVALADEVVLTSGWEHAPAWRQALLEERFYNSQHAGSHFFELARNLDQAPQDVVAVFYLCLALGFSGRYAPADPELAAVKEELLSRLPAKPRIMEEPKADRAQQHRRVRGWLWGGAAAAVLLAVLALGWNQWRGGKSLTPPTPSTESAPPAAQPQPPLATALKAQRPSQTPAKSQAAVSPPEATAEAGRPRAASPPPKAPEVKPDLKARAIQSAQPEPKPPAQTQAQTQAEPTPAEPPTQAVPARAAQAAKPQEAPREEKPQSPAPSEPPRAGVVAQAPPPAEKASAPSAPPSRESYRVRVGVFVGPIQSGRLADNLKEAGLPAVVEKLERAGGKVLYVVSVKPLASREEAERVQARIKRQFKIDALIKQD